MARRSKRSAQTWDDAVRSYQLSLQVDGKRPDTLKSYNTSLAQFRAFLVTQNRPTDPDRIERDDVNAFLADLRVIKERRPGTIATRYDALKGFFHRLEDEGEIDVSPMAKMHRPTVPLTDVPLIPLEVTRALISSCDRRSFNGRRDEALFWVFLDTGLRVGGLVSMTAEGTDLASCP
jgi:site-specific recombinase XerD